jgi:hypothetical protein
LGLDFSIPPGDFGPMETVPPPSGSIRLVHQKPSLPYLSLSIPAARAAFPAGAIRESVVSGKIFLTIL